MNRLQSELHRLYLMPVPGNQDAAPEVPALIDDQGRVRAMVLALARPANWAVLAKLWHGVQVDLELPAPAIAVSGKDAYQLWFSLAEPVPAPQATAFLQALCVRYLGDIKTSRLGLMPSVDPVAPLQAQHAPLVPAAQAASGHWSAFVAPDLAPVFGDQPWLDTAPNPVGQADLLSRLQSLPAADFARAAQQLQPSALAPPAQPAPATEAVAGAAIDQLDHHSTPAGAWRDPRLFLLDVMNNASVALGLRIEAAKALLPYVDDLQRP